MEVEKYPFNCLLMLDEQCNGCGECIKKYEDENRYFEDYEPSEEDLDRWVENQIRLEESRDY